MDNLTYEEYKELKLSLNNMMASRIQYSLDVPNGILKERNDKYLELDRELLKKVIEKIDELKEGVE